MYIRYKILTVAIFELQTSIDKSDDLPKSHNNCLKLSMCHAAENLADRIEFNL